MGSLWQRWRNNPLTHICDLLFQIERAKFNQISFGGGHKQPHEAIKCAATAAESTAEGSSIKIIMAA